MFVRYFKTGEIVLKAETPEELEVNEPYSRFLCDECEYNVSVRFDYTEDIEVRGSIVSKNDSFDVYRDGQTYLFYYHTPNDNDYYAMRVSHADELNRSVVYIPEQYRGKIWTRLVFSLINFEDIAAGFHASVFHSSFVEHNGSAILFTAPCGTGKSTQAALWQKYSDAFIVNGDKTLIYYKENGQLYAAGLPFSGSSDICHNKKMPVKAIVRLGQAKENIIKRLSGISAFKAVFEGCYKSLWNEKFSANTSDLVEFVAKNVPVFSLDCLPDVSAVETLGNAFESIK